MQHLLPILNSLHRPKKAFEVEFQTDRKLLGEQKSLIDQCSSRTQLLLIKKKKRYNKDKKCQCVSMRENLNEFYKKFDIILVWHLIIQKCVKYFDFDFCYPTACHLFPPDLPYRRWCYYLTIVWTSIWYPSKRKGGISKLYSEDPCWQILDTTPAYGLRFVWYFVGEGTRVWFVERMFCLV